MKLPEILAVLLLLGFGIFAIVSGTQTGNGLITLCGLPFVFISCTLIYCQVTDSFINEVEHQTNTNELMEDFTKK